MYISSLQRFSPWLTLVSRLALFAIAQALIASGLLLSGVPDPWGESSRWWVFSMILTNAVSVLWLVRLFRTEDAHYLDLLHFERKTFWADLALTVGVFILAAPIGIIPNLVLAEWLFGDSQAPVRLMFRPLPSWALLLGLLFPVTVAFAELPSYFGYAMPRLERQLGNGWLAWALTALFLSLQHMTVPLILDGRFIMWRALMFLPFALYLGGVLRVRPRLLPYLMVSHFLIDLLSMSTYLAPR